MAAEPTPTGASKSKKAPPPAKAKAKAKPAAKAKAKATPASKAKPVVGKAGGKPDIKLDAKGKPKKVKSPSVAELEAELIGTGVDGKLKKTKKVKPGSALVVVESPAKARTIGKYLGAGYVVKASVGHVRDLPKSKTGVDIEHGFEPTYEVLDGKKKVVAEIRKAAREVETVFLATDPDREGEAIAWHIAEEIKDVKLNHPSASDSTRSPRRASPRRGPPAQHRHHLYDAQQARRILDRIVGYEIGPPVVEGGLRPVGGPRAVGGVRLIVRPRGEIKAFKPEEYWSSARPRAAVPPPFEARLARPRTRSSSPRPAATRPKVRADLERARFVVSKVDPKERSARRRPRRSSRASCSRTRRASCASAKRTMALAQRAVRGHRARRDGGPVGLITYMRTDSTRVSDDALAAVREYIGQTYGADFLPAEPNNYKLGGRAQDAHEAIRPTTMTWTPDKLAVALAEHPEGIELVKLYTLIWQRFVASQMVPAIYDQTTVDIDRGRAQLRATGQIMKFAGYTKVYEVAESDDAKADAADAADRLLPPLEVGDPITIQVVTPNQHFTQPPPRFSEASLVKELEERGIGRPSTYAAIMSTIVDRGYVEKKEARFWPTELGVLVNGLLVESFPLIVSSDFTAKMEADLDHVEEGTADWRKLLGDFYSPFKVDLEKAKTDMRDVKREEIATDFVCEKCGRKMIIRWGRNGSFLACPGFNAGEGEEKCRNTKEIVKNLDGTYDIVPPQTTDELCDVCGAGMTVKRGRFGTFLACSTYPDCKGTKPMSLGVRCPLPGCGGYVAEKRSRRGKPFYGCSNWAKKGCEFVAWDKPVMQPCPVCNAKFVVKKENKRGAMLKCLECDWKQGADEDEEQPAAAAPAT
jgi:DNA topoisomerase-1